MTPDEWAHIRSIARLVLPVLVGPRIARTGASERGAIITNVAARAPSARFLSTSGFRAVLTLICETGRVLIAQPTPKAGFGRRNRGARALLPALPRVGWKTAGVLAVLCSGVAMASLPKPKEIRADEQRQWQALAIAPLSDGGGTGMQIVPTDAAEPIEFAPIRKVVAVAAPEPKPEAAATGPLRIRG